MDDSNGSPLPALVHLNGTFTVNGIQGPNPLAGVTLDVGSSTVYFAYDPASDPVAAIRAALANGYNGGAWNGSATPAIGAIVSAVKLTSGTTAIGYADSADGVVAGQPADTVEVRQTLAGDANLDGTVNLADAAQITSHWNLPGTWDQGDFNYNGVVDVTDALALSRSWNVTLPPPAVAPGVPATAVSPVSPASPAAPQADGLPGGTVYDKRHRGIRKNH